MTRVSSTFALIIAKLPSTLYKKRMHIKMYVYLGKQLDRYPLFLARVGYEKSFVKLTTIDTRIDSWESAVIE